MQNCISLTLLRLNSENFQNFYFIWVSSYVKSSIIVIVSLLRLTICWVAIPLLLLDVDLLTSTIHCSCIDISIDLWIRSKSNKKRSIWISGPREVLFEIVWAIFLITSIWRLLSIDFLLEKGFQVFAACRLTSLFIDILHLTIERFRLSEWTEQFLQDGS